MNEPIRVGLYAGETPVALEGVRVDARLSGPCTEVTVTQRFRNAEPTPIEAVYVFPLEARAAVCGFSARVGDARVEGRVEERERAFEAYDDAMMDGHAAFLLDQERPNVFTASVGNLKPGETAELEIRYVALVDREGDALRLQIPTTVSPRYVPPGPPEVGQPDGERVNPEHRLDVPYGLTLRVQVEGMDLAEVDSPSHPIRTRLRDDGATVELSQDEAALDRDFVLRVTPTEPRAPFARVAREADGRRVALVSFLPDLAPEARGHEVIFVLDCSGSMSGTSIAQARRALSLCIRALGAGDTFDVVRFGTVHEHLFGLPRRYDEESLEEATRWVESVDADLGGTEILRPLSLVLERPTHPDRPRRVLLLTDGQVSNEQEVFAVARKHAAKARVFTFGIGAGASEHLVRGVARASRGASEMISPGERIEPKVLRMFERVRTPVLDDVTVDWGGLDVEQAPATTPPVFAGDALTVLGRIRGGDAREVTLRAGERRWTVPLDLERAVAGGPIPTLWARERIRELEDDTAPRRGSAQRRPEKEARRREAMVELGVRYGLTSRATSYVAVQERADADKSDAPAALRKIPVALTDGWGGVRPGAGAGARTMAGVVRASMPMSAAAPPPTPRMAAPSPAVLAQPAPVPAPPRGGRASKSAGFGGAPSRRPTPVVGALAAGEAAPDPLDRLFDLLGTQRADGRFPWSPALEAWLGASRAAKLEARADDPALVTAVVLALLEREAADARDLWRPAAAKARRWLDTHPTDADVDDLLS